MKGSKDEETMVKSEVIINEELCKGCGFCAYFCPRGCIEMSKDKINSKGFLVPIFNHPENCNTCAYCGIMCPEAAIDIYLSVEKGSSVTT